MDLSSLRRSPPGFDARSLMPPRWQEREWPVTALALDVSGRCNMACRYCAESATQPAARAGMRAQTLDGVLDFMARHGLDGVTPTLRLGSGEPLLALPLLRRLARRLEEARRDQKVAAQVFLTTNGTLIDDEVADWLAATGWHVKVSLDGPAATHDRWRVTRRGRGTWEQVAGAVRMLAERMPDRLSVTAVLARGNDPQEVFAAAAELGVRRIELVPAVHADPQLVPQEADVARYAAFVAGWTRRWMALPRSKVMAEPVKLVGVVRRIMGYDVKRVVCGSGRNFFGVDAQGNLYPCFRFIGMTAYRLGNITDGVDAGAAAAFRARAGRPLESRGACGTCWAAPLCGGPCFACAETFGPGNGEPVPIQCAYVLADAHAAVDLVARLRQKSPRRLLHFLRGLIPP